MNNQEIQKKIKELLFHNLESGYSGHLKHSYTYIKPSPSKYPFQWWWDTFFHCFMLCELDEHDLAKQNFESLFKLQEDNGFVGHMIYWQNLPRNIFNMLEAKPTWKHPRPHMSSLIQPSFAAQALEKLVDHDKEFVNKQAGKLLCYFEWIEQNRILDNTGLISIFAPMESGIDWKPSYDELLGFSGQASFKLYFKMIGLEFKNLIRGYKTKKIFADGYFNAKDVIVNTAYALDLRAMSRIYKKLGKPELSDRFEEKAKKIGEAINKYLYDDETCAFYDYDQTNKKHLKVATPTIFFPIILLETSTERSKKIINKHFKESDQFEMPYPLPSVGKNEPSFLAKESRVLKQDFLWRGPTWILYNWFIYKAFKAKGFDEEAKKIKKTVHDLIEKSGFREYYDPLTGEGYGAKNFTWAGLILDMK